MPFLGDLQVEHESQFFIKNTFITLTDEITEARQPTNRRASSAPADNRCRPGDSTPQHDFSYSLTYSPPHCKFSSSSTTSTKADADSSSDDLEESCGNSAHESFELALDQLVPPSSSPAQKTKLSTASKVWAPLQPQPSANLLVLGGSAMPPEIYRELRDVVEAGHNAFGKCDCIIAEAEISECRLGWTVTGQLQQAAGISERFAFVAAQQALLQAAEESQHIYIVGYEAQPFSPSPTGRGFTAQLAAVLEESTACWDLLAQGSCGRGCHCRWQHPSWKVAIHFTATEQQEA